MYLFIFSVLLIVFQYVNSKNIIDKYEKDIKIFKSKIADNEKEIAELQEQNFELNYFNIDRNEDALTYFLWTAPFCVTIQMQLKSRKSMRNSLLC